MTHAFSELYIENAQRVFAQMTHYVIHDLKMEYDPFFRLFVQSGVAAQFEKGNPRYVAGMSGTELADEVLSIGDYVLTGGELPAMVMVDAVARMLPGVLGSEESAPTDSFYHGLLEYPQYTRPRDYHGKVAHSTYHWYGTCRSSYRPIWL